ncbi:MAG: SUMF1/EgtB/PvdO family nonheme iron enzyme, partial [Candidatus Thermoplasmatota archaeon]|nr:SUMF1/EgtB/PvdO family nonheme iron enzyme [Candidatus Thermoplasmatota archaeon]
LADQPEYRLATAVNETRRLIAAAQSGVPVKPIPRPCPTCPPGMVLIPAGVFWMGGDSRIPSQELPVHSVSVSMFYMDMYEVTKALWDEVAAWAEANGYDIKPSDGWGKAPDHPVCNVSWYEAVKWANARSEKEGLTPCYYTDAANRNVYRTGQVDVKNEWVKWTANGYRLPTEAEWEKAARGGCEGRRFPWCDSDTIDHGRANYLSCPTDRCQGDYPDDVSATKGYNPAYATGEKPYTSPVGSFAANGYGLYDMAGNVAEWCWDSYWGVVYWSGERVDPRGPSFVSERVVRGGSWEYPSSWCWVSSRLLRTTPDGRRGIGGWSLGFRLVRSGL